LNARDLKCNIHVKGIRGILLIARLILVLKPAGHVSSQAVALAKAGPLTRRKRFLQKETEGTKG
jgi:hypothetical protein